MVIEWASTPLENLLGHVIGGDWGKDESYEDPGFQMAVCIRGSEFKNWRNNFGSTSVKRKIKNSSLYTRKLQPNDILIEISGGGPEQPVGRTVLISNKVLDQFSYPVICTNFIRLARPFERISSSFLNYYLTYFYLSGEIINYQGGSNNLRNLKFSKYTSIQIPLPPAAEQKIIADRLDILLAQVEATKTRLERILQILKQFRQSVLAAAVSGRLTKDWRKQNPNKAQEWKIAPLGDFVTIERGSSPRPISQYITESEFGVNWIKIGDAKEGCKYIAATKEKITADGAKKSRHVFPGDFILSNSMSLGRAYIMAIEGFIHDGWFVLRLPSCIKSDFFYYLLSSSEVQNQFNNLAVGGVVKNIRSELVKQAIIKLPPSEEQTEIVRRVEQLFAFADKMEAQVNAAQEKVSQLTQSILAKAFRGELTAQWREEHPELISGENSAQALLERIAAERQTLQSASRGTKEKRGTSKAGKITRRKKAEGATAD